MRIERPITPTVCSRALTSLIAIFLLIHSPAQADTVYDVSINTSSLLGTESMLAFDFIAGGGTQSNSVSISSFSTNGSLIPASISGAMNSGSVTGTLPSNVTLNNASFFNEYQQGITLGSTITFQLDATTSAPAGSSLPDTFSLFFLDPAAANSLLTTTDPTGANSLFTLQIDGSPNGIIGVYDSLPTVSVTITAAPVPIPGSLGLFIGGLAGIGLFGMRKRFTVDKNLF
jgi:hypothetical protein